jgi:hypothetical protein
MMNKTIKRKDIEEIQEMSTEDLVKILQLFTTYRMTENLFVECVRYEIESRHRLESRCSVVGNV